VSQRGREGGGRCGRPGDNEEGREKWGFEEDQASHDFWVRQNCSPPLAPIAHAVTLTLRHWKWKQ